MSHFSLSAGTVDESPEGAITGADTKGSIEGTIPAKDRVAGEVVFEVPTAGAPYVVRFSQPLGSTTADWDVVLP